MKKSVKSKKTVKKNIKSAEKRRNSSHRASTIVQKRFKEHDVSSTETMPCNPISSQMCQMVTRFSRGKKSKKVVAYKTIAKAMSSLAGRTNGDSWSWRYIASTQSKTFIPGKKFISVFELYSRKIKPHHKQWHYFVFRRSVLSFYADMVRAEIIRESLVALGYKSAPHSRYMEAKKNIYRSSQ